MAIAPDPATGLILDNDIPPPPPDQLPQAVNDTDAGLGGRHEAAHLRHERYEGHLPEVGGLPRHVRPGEDYQSRLLIHPRIIGNELFLAHLLFEHRMPPVDDPQHRRPPGEVRDVLLAASGNCVVAAVIVALGYRDGPHAFDAFVCLLAAVDFLEGRAVAPELTPEPSREVRREGWIWIRRPRRPDESPGGNGGSPDSREAPGVVHSGEQR